ncbi:MAG: hypothetical protein ACXAB2_14325 [Candidatus Hodarchaeales archaeon]|jgi:hypothetical protein
MEGLSIAHSSNTKVNPALLVSLLPSLFLRDFKLQEDGLLCILKSDVNDLESILENYLSNLNELTDSQFYFEFLNDNILRLKMYSTDGLQFRESLLFPFSLTNSLKD